MLERIFLHVVVPIAASALWCLVYAFILVYITRYIAKSVISYARAYAIVFSASVFGFACSYATDSLGSAVYQGHIYSLAAMLILCSEMIRNQYGDKIGYKKGALVALGYGLGLLFIAIVLGLGAMLLTGRT